MKNITKFGIVSLLIITLFGCGNNVNTINEHQIVGSWKLVEANISAGGPQYWQEIENGEEFEFLSNGNFSSNKYAECTGGEFSIKSNELRLIYDCNGFNPPIENSEGVVTYEITFASDYFILTPTSVICVEGCSYKYKKVAAK